MKELIFVLFIFSTHVFFAQDESSALFTHRNYYGLSFDLGGKMEKANDIFTFADSEEKGGYANPVGGPNIGFSLFWEHQWNFHRNQGLIFGVGASFTTFDYDIAFKNIEVLEFKTEEHLLGYGFRSSFVSLDLPIYYTYTFKTKFGDINPIVGLNVRDLSFVLNSGRNNGGITGRRIEMSGNDTTYYNSYNLKFGTQNSIPILMPTLGVRYTKELSGGGKLNFHIIGKLHFGISNSPEVYLSNFDNMENGVKYEYYGLNADGSIAYDQKNSIFYRINMSSVNLGVSYSFK